MSSNTTYTINQPIRFLHEGLCYSGVFKYYSLHDSSAALVLTADGEQFRVKLKEIEADSTSSVLNKDNPNITFRTARTKRPVYPEKTVRLQRDHIKVKIKVTAKMVKALRVKTNASLADCVDALEACNGYVKTAAKYIIDKRQSRLGGII